MTSPTPGSRRGAVMSAAGLAASAMLALLASLPASFAIGQPGPTFDTLAELGGFPLVEIDGAPHYDSTGELRLTTVALTRSSDSFFTIGRVVQAWFSPHEYVLPEEVVFGRPDERDAFEHATQQQWLSSQEAATVAALEALGLDVPARMYVVEVDETSHADGKLVDGDRLVALDGVTLASITDLVDHMASVEPGQHVTVMVERDSTTVTVEFETKAGDDGSALMGIIVDTHFDAPVDVTIALDSVGGPSAGLMFSLAIMELLTEGDTLQGTSVAGTGGITIDGEIEAMGGLVQKMYGAARAGADYFVMSTDNCVDVAGHVPAGLVVIPVSRLDQAFDALVDVGAGRMDSLPRCDDPALASVN